MISIQQTSMLFFIHRLISTNILWQRKKNKRKESSNQKSFYVEVTRVAGGGVTEFWYHYFDYFYCIDIETVYTAQNSNIVGAIKMNQWRTGNIGNILFSDRYRHKDGDDVHSNKLHQKEKKTNVFFSLQFRETSRFLFTLSSSTSSSFCKSCFGSLSPHCYFPPSFAFHRFYMPMLFIADSTCDGSLFEMIVKPVIVATV